MARGLLKQIYAKGNLTWEILLELDPNKIDLALMGTIHQAQVIHVSELLISLRSVS